MALIPFLAAAFAAAPAAAERPAPELLTTFPPEGSEVAVPMESITLMFASKADLVEVIVIMPEAAPEAI